MRAVGLKILKNKLSEYVRLAQGGETILVTDRDRVVAELVPPRAGRSPAVADAVLAELVRQGWVTPAARPLTGSLPRAPVAAFEQLMRELDEARDDR
jgi:antitoxin (DNA-binding transcriptional repressor) of toxin-antitoxin stability system